MPAQANRVHVITAGHRLAIEEGAFQLTRNVHDEIVPTLIDRFLRALAREHENAAVGIILSVTGSDGALGLNAIGVAGSTIQ